jgi:hypothetical protein
MEGVVSGDAVGEGGGREKESGFRDCFFKINVVHQHLIC